MFRSSVLVFLIAVSALIANQPAEKKATSKSQSRIQKRTYDFKEAGKQMEYALFVPTTYDKEKKAPLIVALHGLGSIKKEAK